MATTALIEPDLDQDDEEQPSRIPGTVAPAETNTPANQSGKNYGPNNEKLPKKLQEKLRWLLRQYASENSKARRFEVRRVRQAHEFWKGLQYQYWSEVDGSWRLPNEMRSGQEADSANAPRYSFVTNYFQAFGLSLIAVISQDTPAVHIWPADSDNDADVAFAGEASAIVEVIETNNRPGSLLRDVGFHMFCGGKVGGYVRYVADGQRFGYTDQPELEMMQTKLGDDAYLCPDPNCQTMTPSQNYMGVCQTCGGELDDDADFSPAPMVNIPRVATTIRMPNGAEIIDIEGALTLKTPMWAQQQHEFPYIIRERESHLAKLRASYPHAAKKIKQSAGGGQAESDPIDRQSRLAITVGGPNSALGDSAAENLTTFVQGWLRPWAFYLLDEEDEKGSQDAAVAAPTDEGEEDNRPVREQLLDLFPDGCYCAFAGDAYCESRNESMDDCWRIAHALPGDGQDRNGIGTSFIPVQERINILDNLETEQVEYGIPATFADPTVLDFEAYGASTAEPGAMYEATAKAGQALSDGFFQTEPAQLSSDVAAIRENLTGEAGQFLTGAFPALFGGDTGENDTMGGIGIQRDQALGRIGLVWREVKYFWADLMVLGVMCFARNRTDDVKAQVTGDSGNPSTKVIPISSLKGKIVGYPETDEQYPQLWSQQRSVLLTLMQSTDPMIQAIMGHPDNLAFIKRLIGLEQFVIPDEESRMKQHEEIEQMLEEEPSEQLVTDPMSGIAAPQLQPSVGIDEQVDNNQVEAEVCARWLNGKHGQKAKRENPMGFMNVRAHYLMHLAVVVQQQQQAAMAAAAAQGPQGPGGKSKGAPQNEAA